MRPACLSMSSINSRSNNEVTIFNKLPKLSSSTNYSNMAIARVVIYSAHDKDWINIKDSSIENKIEVAYRLRY